MSMTFNPPPQRKPARHRTVYLLLLPLLAIVTGWGCVLSNGLPPYFVVVTVGLLTPLLVETRLGINHLELV